MTASQKNSRPAASDDRRKTLGAAGERFAADYLEKKGYLILERNCRSRIGEIDIIAQTNDELVFVEVKTRSSDRAGDPLEAITPAKAARLKRLAAEYLRAHPDLRHCEPRIDCIGILVAGGKCDLEHVESAVE